MNPKLNTCGESALIACALKSRKIHIIMLIPGMTGDQDLDKTNLDTSSQDSSISPRNKYLKH